VIFVSHKLEEVEELCDRVTVMRLGQVVGEAQLPCSTEQLVEMMFGKVVTPAAAEPIERGAPVVRLEAVTLRSRLVTTTDLSLEVNASEIVGLAGLEGSGQRLLLQACTGLLAPETGVISLDGRDMAGRSYRDYLDAKVHYLPAGRLEEGLVHGLTITEHLLLAAGAPEFFVDWDEARATAERLIDEFSIKGTPESTAEALSGGNQQRLLLAMMPEEIRLLLMEHPTRGLDIESADWVWSTLLRRRERGTAIMFASADLDELLRYSDRILVFFGGRVLQVLDARATDGEELGHLIGGKELA
jgi:ABC-type uncharacterized transport system ATPase subunit